MKILLVNLMPLTGSGSGVYAANIANALVRKGHEVCCIFVDNIISSEKYNFKTHPIYFDNKDIKDSLPFNFPCFTTHPRSVFNFRDMTNEQIAQYENAFREAIKEEVEAFQPDVIHSGHIWISSAIATGFDVPVIVTCHGTDLQGFRESDRYHDFADKAADAAKSIICISEQNLEEAKECFPDDVNKMELLLNGYDEQIFYQAEKDRAEVLAEYGITKEYKNLVSFVGKFAHFKGIDILLKAASKYEDGETATLLAGDGALFSEMEQLAKDLNLKDVYFVHNQPHNKLRELYNVADVSLVPSRAEPFGLVAIEANACGTPVIGTNDGGMVDILTDKTGILIDPENPEMLAEKVRMVLTDKNLFDRKYIAEYTKKKFSQDSLIDKVIGLYKK